ncbi:DUF4176 domain-containing protein [Pasteurella sp. PK-2025]|uniref:DUF4176 domain-containing protein n=1 Tax=Pasteurella sp. PK-2025 TaxID=3413133 RepID=UPI003C77A7FA
MTNQQKLLPLGSVISLHGAAEDGKLMIINRVVLGQSNGEEGYFEYAGCPHQMGAIGEKFFYFNTENIEKVHFLGFSADVEETEFQLRYQAFLENKPLKKLSLRGE